MNYHSDPGEETDFGVTMKVYEAYLKKNGLNFLLNRKHAIFGSDRRIP